MHDNDKNWCDAIIHYNTIQFIAQEPPRNLHHLFQDPAYIFKSFTTTFPKTYHKISAILTDLQEDFPERLSRTANFAEHLVYIVYPFQGNLRNPPHPAGNRRANRRNLLNLETDLLVSPPWVNSDSSVFTNQCSALLSFWHSEEREGRACLDGSWLVVLDHVRWSEVLFSKFIYRQSVKTITYLHCKHPGSRVTTTSG